MGQMYDSATKMYGSKGVDNENLLKAAVTINEHA